MLIGINTWVHDKRESEGLGFAIGFDSFLDLDPPGVHVPAAEPAKRVPAAKAGHVPTHAPAKAEHVPAHAPPEDDP